VGAFITILLGTKNLLSEQKQVETWLSIAALCLSAVIPIIAACEAFFDPRWLWVQYTATLGRIYSISDDLEYLIASEEAPLSRDKLDELYNRLQAALQETNTAWTSKRLKDEGRSELSK
jgi:hypothetical protein